MASNYPLDNDEEIRKKKDNRTEDNSDTGSKKFALSETYLKENPDKFDENNPPEKMAINGAIIRTSFRRSNLKSLNDIQSAELEWEYEGESGKENPFARILCAIHSFHAMDGNEVLIENDIQSYASYLENIFQNLPKRMLECSNKIEDQTRELVSLRNKYQIDKDHLNQLLASNEQLENDFKDAESSLKQMTNEKEKIERELKNIKVQNEEATASKGCPFPDCNGDGNVNPTSKTHRIIKNCPKYAELLKKSEKKECKNCDENLKNKQDLLKRIDEMQAEILEEKTQNLFNEKEQILSNKIKTLEENIQNLEKIEKSLKSQLKKKEEESLVKQSEIDALKTSSANEKNEEKICEYEKQNILSNKIKTLEENIQNLEKIEKSLKSQLKKKEEESLVKQSEIDALKTSSANEKNEEKIFKKEIEFLRDEIALHEKHNFRKNQEINHLKEQYKKINLNCRDLEAEIKKKTEETNDLMSRNDKLQEAIFRNQKTIQELSFLNEKNQSETKERLLKQNCELADQLNAAIHKFDRLYDQHKAGLEKTALLNEEKHNEMKERLLKQNCELADQLNAAIHKIDRQHNSQFENTSSHTMQSSLIMEDAERSGEIFKPSRSESLSALQSLNFKSNCSMSHNYAREEDPKIIIKKTPFSQKMSILEEDKNDEQKMWTSEADKQIKLNEVNKILSERPNITHIGYYTSSDLRTNGRPVFQGSRQGVFYISRTGIDTYIKEAQRYKVRKFLQT